MCMWPDLWRNGNFLVRRLAADIKGYSLIGCMCGDMLSEKSFSGLFWAVPKIFENHVPYVEPFECTPSISQSPRWCNLTTGWNCRGGVSLPYRLSIIQGLLISLYFCADDILYTSGVWSTVIAISRWILEILALPELQPWLSDRSIWKFVILSAQSHALVAHNSTISGCCRFRWHLGNPPTFPRNF